MRWPRPWYVVVMGSDGPTGANCILSERIDFRSVCVKRADDLKKHLLIGVLLHRNDPRCRFVWVSLVYRLLRFALSTFFLYFAPERKWGMTGKFLGFHMVFHSSQAALHFTIDQLDFSPFLKSLERAADKLLQASYTHPIHENGWEPHGKCSYQLSATTK